MDCRTFELVRVLCIAYQSQRLRLYINLESLRVLYADTIGLLKYVGLHYNFFQELCLCLRRLWDFTMGSIVRM